MFINTKKKGSTDMHLLKKIIKKKGFSLPELLIVVGIMAIVAAIGIPALASYNKMVNETRLDDTARQIFVAVQNQMTELKSSGTWDQLVAGGTDPGTQMTAEPSDYEYWLEYLDLKESNSWTTDQPNMYVLSHIDRNTDGSLINSILPYGAVDETYLNNGQYFIEYNLATATVYSVTYTDSSQTVTYEADVIGGLDRDGGRPTGSETANATKSVRMNHRAASENPAMLGYYGGGIATDYEGETLQDITMTVLNGEDLVIAVTDPNSNSSEPEKTYLMITVKGLESGETATFITSPRRNNYSDATYSVDVTTQTLYNVELEEDNSCIRYYIILDRIGYDEDSFYTESHNLHFKNQCHGLIPGENITVKATVIATDIIANPVSKQETTNGIFSWKDGSVAEITQMRHLENLDPDISGLETMGTDIVKQAEFKASVSWDNSGLGIQEIWPKDYSDKIITDIEGAGFAYTAGSYVPVNNNALTEIMGDEYMVFNIHSVSTGSAIDYMGIFGSTSADISSLGLVSYPFKQPCKVTFKGKGFIGGIAGEYTGDKMEFCWSTALITNTYDGGASGALAGRIKSNTSVTVANCYSGGKTQYAAYNITPSDMNILTTGDSGVSGGLIGYSSTAGLTIENCYTTTSAAAIGNNAYSGGIIGYADHLSMDNCYNAAPVGIQPRSEDGVTYSGMLVGNSGTGISVSSNCCYIEGRQVHWENATGAGDSGREGLNESGYGSYRKPSELKNCSTNAYPYDPYLGSEYVYTEVTGMTHHYGDWCEYECFVRAEVSPFYVDVNNKVIAHERWDENDSDIITYNSTDWQFNPDDNYWYYKEAVEADNAGLEDLVNSFNGSSVSYTEEDGAYATYEILYEYLQVAYTGNGTKSCDDAWNMSYDRSTKTWSTASGS